MAGKLEFHFSHTFEGSIWNMIVVPETAILVMEVRNDERRRVNFSALDVEARQFLWMDIQSGEPWWVNLSSAGEGKVFLTKFDSTENPDAVSLLQIDLQTGRLTEENKPGDSFVPEARRSAVTFPVRYGQESAYFGIVKEFILKQLDYTPVNTIEYLESSGLIFMSIYLQDGLNFVNHLLVFDESGTLLVDEIIGEALKGFGMETFFLYNGFLFYVKNKVELVTYRIL